MEHDALDLLKFYMKFCAGGQIEKIRGHPDFKIYDHMIYRLRKIMKVSCYH